eukprot:CAMPEP_0119355228 /NCGR_PEP_ID=MMETSP1334-20130426/4087_1 /TAXON_ID=127549 /ORGANISM="Calcidiscus leptoporus, Strain RCC1130" /LENGTH=128 /DNA_ID=CAMNT_0007368983 /DNA_START=558 /DNA_END=941 /DNA_ORIENTATION=-
MDSVTPRFASVGTSMSPTRKNHMGRPKLSLESSNFGENAAESASSAEPVGSSITSSTLSASLHAAYAVYISTAFAMFALRARRKRVAVIGSTVAKGIERIAFWNPISAAASASPPSARSLTAAHSISK